ncbi:hypothetical protein MTR_2g084320 [Medicago truncatula]|uniref:Uncharacterized protein n=1 Tax=Medicago truncatula TaxID=3880 RepID=A0A072VL88_MEDTR|nr:hypothetical protein MTR_2g084320 [Medicago truncatula]
MDIGFFRGDKTLLQLTLLPYRLSQDFGKTFNEDVVFDELLHFYEVKLFVWLFLHMVRRRQTVLSELESDIPSEENKSGQSHSDCCRVLQDMLPSETESIRALTLC